MRHRLTKEERKAVYDKCGGHCAYCGCEISFKGFHVDHIKCLRLHEWEDDMIDTISNMLPACGSCNRYKSTYDLETFRRMLSGIPKRLARDISTYNIAVRFGIVEEHNEPIKFYFERESVRGHVDGESVNVYANGSWIPVEEQTPEPRVDVLADFGGDTPIIAWHSNVSGWKNSSTDMEVSRRVIAWRPLPEPYQAERRT